MRDLGGFRWCTICGWEVAAILYTLVETAKLHAVDPTKYLLDAVRAADRGETLFPWQMPSAM